MGLAIVGVAGDLPPEYALRMDGFHRRVPSPRKFFRSVGEFHTF
jgi:hypothetical protein